jgi:hypothetical protein
MLRLLIGTAALSLASSSDTLRSRDLADPLPEDSKTQSSKNLKGQFQVVGTLCYDENMAGTDQVIVTTTSKASPHQRVVMYDDQYDSFPAAFASSTCKEQLSFAKKLKLESSGENLVPGWSIAGGGSKTEKITIQGKVKRQWIVAIINCDESTGTPYTVDVDSVSITAVKNIDCESIHQPSAGPTVAIVFLTLALLASLVLLILMWKKASSAPKGLTNIDGAGYNEL